MGYPKWQYEMRDGQVHGEIFDSEELPEGWFDTPKECREGAKDEKHPEISEAQENASDAASELKEALKDMDKEELEEFAKREFGVDLDKRKKLETLVKEVADMIDGLSD